MEIDEDVDTQTISMRSTSGGIVRPAVVAATAAMAPIHTTGKQLNLFTVNTDARLRHLIAIAAE
jgi:hypothetical protein